MKRWTKQEEDFLIKNYEKFSYDELCEQLGRNESAIKAKAHDLGIHKINQWTNNEIKILKENYSTNSFSGLMKLLPGRNRNAIQLKASKLGLPKRKYIYDFRFFQNIDGEEKAYWLGFFYSDGCVYINPSKRVYESTIKLCRSDYKHLKKFNKSIKGNVPVEFSTRICSFNNLPQESCEIRCHSKDMAYDLISHGCVPNKTFVIEFPELREDLIHHFIRGYFDGDGCISTDSNQRKTVAINFCSASLKMLEKMREILYKNKICSYITEEKNKSTYRLYIRGLNNTDNMWEYMFSDATIYLDRKVAKKERLYKEYNIAQRLLRSSEMAG